MKEQDNRLEAFFALLRAGLWEQSIRVSSLEPIDFAALYTLADEQSVVGLIAAGLDHVEDRKIAKMDARPFLTKVYSLETRNALMNAFIAGLVSRMRSVGIYSVLVKGQGVAQCYSRPQWRSSGDVDFLLDVQNYQKAKSYLIPLADYVEKENMSKRHLGLSIDPWFVELHGSMHSSISSRINRGLDEVQKDTIDRGGVRAWRVEDFDIFVPNPDNDVVFIFSHILQHLYSGGIGLRQICDWVRLLYFYRDSIDVDLLQSRIQKMGILPEWKAFGCFAVEYLGFSHEDMPMYDESKRWKAKHILSFVLEKGNFGRSVDNSYREKTPTLNRKIITLWRQIKDASALFCLSPLNATCSFAHNFSSRVISLFK